MLSALTTPGNTHENTANINNILVAVEKSDKNKKGKYALRVSTESDRRQQRKTRVTRAKFVGITKQNSRFVEDVNANADADVLAEEEEESEEEEEEEECRRIFFILFFRSPQRFVGGSGWWSRSLSSVKKTTSATRRERILYSFFRYIFLFEIVER